MVFGAGRYCRRVGFSPVGLIVSLAVLAPNFLLLLPLRDPAPAVRLPPLLDWVERAGQALCLVVPAITAPGVLTWWWAVPVAAGLAGYYALWVRYLRAGRPVAALYRRACGVPVPMAILPVVVFLAASGWLGNPWIAAAAVVLGAGHIPAAMITARTLDVPR